MTRFNILIVLLACSLASSAQVLKGVVQNGTTRTPAAGDEVILLSLGQGMQEEARTKTNAKGEFSFKLADSSSPHLVRVRHRDVNYHEPAPPGKTALEITVYDSTARVAEVKVIDQSQVFEAQDNALRVIELFRVRNASVPPVTQPTFEFYLPEGATVQLGQARSASGMPVKSAPVPLQEKNKYAFMYPLRPGMTQFEVVYSLPYQGSLKIAPKFDLQPEKFFALTPKSMNFSATGGSVFHDEKWSIEPDFDVASRATEPAAGKQVAFEISGTGSLPQDDQGQQQANGRAEDNRPGGGLGVPNEKPNPISSGQWAFLGVLSLFLAGGGVLVFFMNQQNASAVQPQGGAVVMNALMEEMFQLESDKAQGKVTQQEYNIAKATLDRTLQRTMKRKKG